MYLFRWFTWNQKAIKITTLDKGGSGWNADWHRIKGMGGLWSMRNPYRNMQKCQSRAVFLLLRVYRTPSKPTGLQALSSEVWARRDSKRPKCEQKGPRRDALNKWVVYRSAATSIDAWKLTQIANCGGGPLSGREQVGSQSYHQRGGGRWRRRNEGRKEQKTIADHLQDSSKPPPR